MNQAPDSGSRPKWSRTTWASVSKLFRMSTGSRQTKSGPWRGSACPAPIQGSKQVGKKRPIAAGQSNHMTRGVTHLHSKGRIRQNPDRDQSGTRNQRLRPAQQFTAPEEKGGFGYLTSLAEGPDCLATNRVPSNNLPPHRFQPYAPLAPHRLSSQWFRKPQG